MLLPAIQNFVLWNKNGTCILPKQPRSRTLSSKLLIHIVLIVNIGTFTSKKSSFKESVVNICAIRSLLPAWPAFEFSILSLTCFSSSSHLISDVNSSTWSAVNESMKVLTCKEFFHSTKIVAIYSKVADADNIFWCFGASLAWIGSPIEWRTQNSRGSIPKFCLLFSGTSVAQSWLL